MLETDVLIVGAGHGGSAAALALRKQGFAGSILMIGDEGLFPYERPPLSKDFLAREKPFERILIRPANYWAELKIDTLLDHGVTIIEADARRAVLADGTEIRFEKLIWSSGGAARKLTCPGHDLAGVHTVRHHRDVKGIMKHLDAGASKAVVIGGGYIGLEGAAVLRKLGLEVTLLEMADRLLSRVAGEDISNFFAKAHRENGVDVRLGTGVIGIEGTEGQVSGVQLSDGSTLESDMAIVGIGIDPVVAPLQNAGARCSNGVLVDPHCETSLPGI